MKKLMNAITIVAAIMMLGFAGSVEQGTVSLACGMLHTIGAIAVMTTAGYSAGRV